jgi:hypothetical protein
MALAHNGIIRGLNSIALQATHIPRKNRTATKDFLIYCQCWSESMHHHIEQHRSFTPGFEAFHEYAQTCMPENYDGIKLKNLVEAFAEPLVQHLHDEIDTLRSLDVYDSARVRQAYKHLEKKLMDTDNVSAFFTIEGMGVADLIAVSNWSTGVWHGGSNV